MPIQQTALERCFVSQMHHQQDQIEVGGNWVSIQLTSAPSQPHNNATRRLQRMEDDS